MREAMGGSMLFSATSARAVSFHVTTQFGSDPRPPDALSSTSGVFAFRGAVGAMSLHAAVNAPATSSARALFAIDQFIRVFSSGSLDRSPGGGFDPRNRRSLRFAAAFHTTLPGIVV